MKEIDEKLSTYLDRIERLEGQFFDKSIVISSTVRTKEILIDGDDERISKEPILWRLYQHNMFYIVNVPAGTVVKKHSHQEDLFRFIAKGSLLLNNEFVINSGEWFVIKAGTPYEITTKEGYTSFAAYTSICQTNRGTKGSHLVKKTVSRTTKKEK